MLKGRLANTYAFQFFLFWRCLSMQPSAADPPPWQAGQIRDLVVGSATHSDHKRYNSYSQNPESLPKTYFTACAASSRFCIVTITPAGIARQSRLLWPCCQPLCGVSNGLLERLKVRKPAENCTGCNKNGRLPPINLEPGVLRLYR
jgi:hypothetical protein